MVTRTQTDLNIAIPTLLEVAMALSHLHASSLVHMDLKPENVLIKATTVSSAVMLRLDASCIRMGARYL